MDNLTHSLVAVTLSRAGLRRLCPKATLLLLIAANIPDIDLVSVVKSPLAALELHSGYTHSLIGLLPLVFLTVFVTRWIARTTIPIGRGCLLALIGVASHLFLDWTSSYGIRGLLPFSSRWFFLDLNAYSDGIILASLLLAFLAPWFVDLVSGEIGRRGKQGGQGVAIAVLLFLALYEGGRWNMHQQALSKLASRTYDGQTPLRVSALAELNNPFAWSGIIETEDAFRVVKTGWIELGDASDSRVFRKPRKTTIYRAVMQKEPFRYMTYFSRFPAWTFEEVQLGSKLGQSLSLTDLRFGSPPVGRFHAIAFVDESGRIRDTGFRVKAIGPNELLSRFD